MLKIVLISTEDCNGSVKNFSVVSRKHYF